METILKRLEKHGYDSNHPDYEVLVEILTTVKMLKETVEPFVSFVVSLNSVRREITKLKITVVF